MKKVSIQEGQLKNLMKRLMESSITDGNFGKSSVERIGNGEVTTSPVITDKNGDDEFSDPMTSYDMADTMTPQQWGVIRGRRSTPSI